MEPNLKLYIDASALHHSGGGATHLYNFLYHNKFDEFVEIKIFCNNNLINKLPYSPKYKFSTNYFINSGLFNRILWVFFYFNPLIIFKKNVIILNVSNNIIFHPKTYTVSHNLLPFDNDFINTTNFKTKFKYKILRIYQLISFYFSKKVIFVSKTLENSVSLYYKLIQNKSLVIYNATDANCSSKIIDKIAKNIFYVSSAHLYKNQLNVVKAFEMIFRLDNSIYLYLIGDYKNNYGKKIINYINTLSCKKNILFYPTLDSVSLFEMYKKCDIYISASSCESFGINLLDAMRYKIPIACSNILTYKELFSNYVVFFNPKDIESISSSIISLIDDFEIRLDLSQKGYEFSKNFTWEKSSNDLYNHLLL